MKIMRNKKLEYFLSFLLILSILILWICGDFYQTSKNILPEDIKTFDGFIHKMPPPESIHIFEKNNSQFIEIIGKRAGFPAVPSGNPIYIFDRNGEIVMWVLDSGDSTSYWENWGNKQENVKKVSINEAREFILKNQNK